MTRQQRYHFDNLRRQTLMAAYVRRLGAGGGEDPIDLSKAIVQFDKDYYPYSEQPISPVVFVTYDGALLVKDVDYTMVVLDNVDVGHGKVILTGIGRCVNSKIALFEIRPMWNFDLSKTNGKTYRSYQPAMMIRSMSQDPNLSNDMHVLYVDVGSSRCVLSALCWDEQTITSISSVTSTPTQFGFNCGICSIDSKSFIASNENGLGAFYKLQASLPFAINEFDNSTPAGAEQITGFETGVTVAGPFGFSKDLMMFYHMAYKNNIGYILYVYELESPGDLSNKTLFSQKSGFTSKNIVMSPYGDAFINLTSATNIDRYVMSTPFDVRNAVKMESFILGGGVCSDSGTPFIVTSDSKRILFFANNGYMNLYELHR